MRFINRGRRTGKTTMLIYASSVTGAPIIVYDKVRAELIKKQARDLGIEIEVFTLLDWTQHNCIRAREYNGVLIDEAKELIEAALSAYLQTNVFACTFSIPMTEIKDINRDKDNE